MADLGKTSAAMAAAIEIYTGLAAGTGLAHLNDGYVRFLSGLDPTSPPDSPMIHQFSFLQPFASLTIGGAQAAVAADGDVAGEVTVTDPAAGIFNESMVGLQLTVTDIDGAGTDATVEITGVSSATVAQTDGTTAFAAKVLSVESNGIIALPSDFGGLITGFTYRPNATYPTSSMEEASVDEVMARWRDRDGDTEDVLYWSIAPLTFTTGTGQRWVAAFAPLPDVSRVLYYRYSLLADALADDANYPLGGPLHARTIEAAGLASAELSSGRVLGTMEMRFQQLMAASIALDRTMFQTQSTEQLTDVDVGFD